ncbi:hypothetical protein BDZ91DRAFT_768240 [Kalaharituber pfeilii]|nr:hypothetical protein BDZ91DRAFT_768240 [Kalaharituber pfeilii]
MLLSIEPQAAIHDLENVNLALAYEYYLQAQKAWLEWCSYTDPATIRTTVCANYITKKGSLRPQRQQRQGAGAKLDSTTRDTGSARHKHMSSCYCVPNVQGAVDLIGLVGNAGDLIGLFITLVTWSPAIAIYTGALSPPLHAIAIAHRAACD